MIDVTITPFTRSYPRKKAARRAGGLLYIASLKPPLKIPAASGIEVVTDERDAIEEKKKESRAREKRRDSSGRY